MRRISRVAFLAAFSLLPRAKAQNTVSTVLRPARDVFITVQPAYTLRRKPAAGAMVQVYLNGLLMAEGIDYTYSAGTVTFLGSAQPIGPGAIIQVLYSVTD